MSQLYQGIANRGITVGVELHGMTYNVGHLIIASIVEQFHRVEYASLYRFETITQVGDGTFENDVRGLI